MNEIQLTGICAEIARLMIKYGAEIYRVEDTISRICRAYGHSEAEIYATPANFIITVKDKNNVPFTDSKSISGRDTNLDRVGKINELSRFICSEKPEAEVILKKLELIKNRKTYSPAVIYTSYFVAGGAFTMFFEGTPLEALFGGILGLVIHFLSIKLKKVGASAFLNAV